ncbi:NADPH-dependent FMN reductase [Thermodesulfobium narugense DSM 14796]|uniref:NADPH-dependent FMN reductase n=1 Tax=Thermodesulfobium narugense DSM 14796 TaxID=747365 RepID=M1E7J6_9BACT|nr:flavodoxin family protein [Thermodesulfobium narugense]AEE14019.1 NADPH-dependent FMN reductase [Thermodesulfobium narugense DSM 14796]
MKALAINASARKDSNTAIMLNKVLSELEKDGIEKELYQMAGKKIHGCTACYKCISNKDKRCAVDDDIFNECFEKMVNSDIILLGSPIYFADITPELKCLIDRAGMVARANDFLLKRKIGAAVIVNRRAGGIHGFDSVNHFFLIEQMIVVGSSYWNIGIGRNKGEVEKDEEGIKTMIDLAHNISWLAKKLK